MYQVTMSDHEFVIKEGTKKLFEARDSNFTSMEIFKNCEIEAEIFLTIESLNEAIVKFVRKLIQEKVDCSRRLRSIDNVLNILEVKDEDYNYAARGDY